jgi:hypothetical protein
MGFLLTSFVLGTTCILVHRHRHEIGPIVLPALKFSIKATTIGGGILIGGIGLTVGTVYFLIWNAQSRY